MLLRLEYLVMQPCYQEQFFFYFEENVFMQTNVLNIAYGYVFRHILNNPTWAHDFLYPKLWSLVTTWPSNAISHKTPNSQSNLEKEEQS